MINNNRIILHCDINNFFASVECATKPELKNKPVAVSGNPAKRTGVILAKNEIAKSFGVSTGEAIWQAKAKCKDLVCLPPHMELYQEISEQIKVIYKQFTDKIEPFGIDECWLDVTDSAHLFGGGEKIAEKLRSMIKRTFNMTASVGISFCKLFAKIGSDLKKPDAQTLISRENFEELLYPMPACSIIGVGKSTQKTLAHLNINTLGELAKSDEKMLKSKLGIVGVMLKQKLLGNDFDEVTDISEEEEIKSIGNGTTTIKDIFTREEVEKTVYHLSEMIATRLRQHSFCAATVGVSIKNADLECFA
ncbi:MAG: DNA polymerase IV, partial [Clostridia bacterium]